MEIDETIHDNLPQEELHSMWTPFPPPIKTMVKMWDWCFF